MTETKGEVSVMASFLDNLRRMVGMKPRNDEEPKKKQEQPDRVGAFAALSAQLLSCEDEAQKAEIREKMCKALPDTLFLAPMCYEGEDPNAPVSDRALHATVGAHKVQGVLRVGNLFGLVDELEDARGAGDGVLQLRHHAGDFVEGLGILVGVA